VCGKRFSVDKKYKNYFLTDFCWFCSPECVYQYIENRCEILDPMKVRKGTMERPAAYDVDKLDMCFRSKFEGVFALWATYQGLTWDYECVAIPHEKERWYNPDFLIDKKVMVEIKGKWLGAGKKKLIQAKNSGHEIILIPYYMEPMFRKVTEKLQRRERNGKRYFNGSPSKND
jgi:hypothetical protein